MQISNRLLAMSFMASSDCLGCRGGAFLFWAAASHGTSNTADRAIANRFDPFEAVIATALWIDCERPTTRCVPGKLLAHGSAGGRST
jgi:hypothetical protein